MYELDFDPKGFEWIDFRDTESNVVAFLRRGSAPDQILVFVFNFTPVSRAGYRIGSPLPGFYRELINSDSNLYGGSNVGLDGGVTADPIPWHNQPYSLNINLPPLGMLVLKPASV